ncbi:hypothetical protein FPHYL_4912 [Fusarium phyllophilum]|uniref:Zn(2)-C6 fungal-type domain-containing protein n=1 Tax=Fusarium phyllophilum TaxID=47803 RepID=A0A8H5K129_9HYPO|nr:hypothetical protein FPHYL_4912 [Fusarium phyllophilum]
MHTHPNQIRSACERCRRQKLRCSRSLPSPSCARCTRLGLTCQAGLQRRVGRPPKKDMVLRKPAEDMQFVQALMDDTAWNLDPFCGYTPESLLFPMDAWPSVSELDPPELEQKIIVPSMQVFEKLSKLNVDIHRGWEFVSQLENDFRLITFVCEDRERQNGYQNIQVVLKAAQEYLVVLKTLHRQLGTRTVYCQGRKPHTNRTMLSLEANTVSPESIASSSGGATPTSGSTTPELPPVFDSPTMFLTISCYVQLTKHLEVVLRIIFNSISDPHQDLIDAAPMSFADVPLIEPSTQFVLFSEMFRHIMSQMNLLMGLPSAWSSQSAWTGLLTNQLYRDMLNTELGDVEDGWTTRPGKLMEINRITKDMLDEFTMMGIY